MKSFRKSQTFKKKKGKEKRRGKKKRDWVEMIWKKESFFKVRKNKSLELKMKDSDAKIIFNNRGFWSIFSNLNNRNEKKGKKKSKN